MNRSRRCPPRWFEHSAVSTKRVLTFAYRNFLPCPLPFLAGRRNEITLDETGDAITRMFVALCRQAFLTFAFGYSRHLPRPKWERKQAMLTQVFVALEASVFESNLGKKIVALGLTSLLSLPTASLPPAVTSVLPHAFSAVVNVSQSSQFTRSSCAVLCFVGVRFGVGFCLCGMCFRFDLCGVSCVVVLGFDFIVLIDVLRVLQL